MKTTKKLLTLALAALMLLSLAAPAMADDSDFVIYDGHLSGYYGPGGDIVIPAGVTRIDNENASIFRSDRDKVTGITVPEGVNRIGNCAFSGLENLVSVSIPSSVTYLGTLMFMGCTSLTDVYFGGPEAKWAAITAYTSPIFDEGVNPTIHYNSTGPDDTTTPTTPEPAASESAMADDSDFWIEAYEDGVKELLGYSGPGGDVVVPTGVTQIASNVFAMDPSLTSVTFPSGVITIGFQVFFSCDNLKSVTIPASVTYIGECTFSLCPSLTDIYFGGTEAQWAAIEKNLKEWGAAIGSELTILDEGSNVTVHYNSTGPAASTTPTTPEPAASESAMPTNDQLTVNGALQSPTVYKIGGSNFFKIRDLAAMLNGTEKQFDVGYDGALASVTLTTGKGYAKLDTDLAGAATGGNQTANPSNDTIYINGQKIDVTVYKIGGSNYFKLRDLGKALDFYVGWTAKDGVFIDTSKPYSD